MLKRVAKLVSKKIESKKLEVSSGLNYFWKITKTIFTFLLFTFDLS